LGGGLGATYNDHLRPIEKRVVDNLLIELRIELRIQLVIELFRQMLRLRRYERRSENRRFRSNAVALTQNFR